MRVGLVILGLSIFSIGGYPQDSLEERLNQRISLDFKDMDIVEALKFLATKAGLNIIPTNQVKGRVTLMIEDAAIKDIFDIMLRSNGLAYQRKGDIFNVMTEDEYKKLYGKDFSDRRIVKIFRLKYAVPEQVYELCDTLKSDIGKVLLNPESGTILVIDTPEKVREIKSAVESLENKNTVIKIFDLKYAQAKDIADQLKNQLDLKKLGSIRADERTNQVIVQTLPERIDEIEKIIRGLDQKTKQVLVEVRIIKINLSNSLSKGVEWEGLFNAGKKYGLMYIGSYPFSAVQAKGDDWRSRLKVLQDLKSSLSIDSNYVGSYPFSGTITDESGYASGRKSTGTEEMHIGVIGKHDFDTIIKYLRTLGEVKIVATPKVAIINNHQARLHIGERQAYLTNTTTQTASTTTIAEEVTFIDIGIQLFITPTINEEGYVTLNLKPEISSISSYLTTAQGNKIPIVNTSTAETTVIVKSGSTIIIGGLKEEKETKEAEEVPFFSRIPLLGGLFSSTTRSSERSELLVMVTPHIIEGDELTTGYERDLGYKLDKEEKPYKPFVPQKILKEFKSYQPYLDLKEEKQVPTFKPMKNMGGAGL